MATSSWRYAPTIKIGLPANCLPRWKSKPTEPASAHCKSSSINTRGTSRESDRKTRVYCSKKSLCCGLGINRLTPWRSTASFRRLSQSAPSGAQTIARWTKAAPGINVSIRSGPDSTSARTVSGSVSHKRRAWFLVMASASRRASTSPVSIPKISRKGR